MYAVKSDTSLPEPKGLLEKWRTVVPRASFAPRNLLVSIGYSANSRSLAASRARKMRGKGKSARDFARDDNAHLCRGVGDAFCFARDEKLRPLKGIFVRRRLGA